MSPGPDVLRGACTSWRNALSVLCREEGPRLRPPAAGPAWSDRHALSTLQSLPLAVPQGKVAFFELRLRTSDVDLYLCAMIERA